MASFQYKALDKGGKEVRGNIDATSEEAVVERLRNMGYFATDVSRVKVGVGQMDLAELPIFRLIHRTISRGKVGLKDLSAFTRQLATLVGAGLPLLRSLQILHEQVENRNMKEAIEAIADDVEGGSTLSEAMAKHPRIFNRLFVNMIKAGEIGGALEQVLDRLALFSEKAAAIRSKVKGAMWYPIAVVFFASVVVTMILWKVVPAFTKMYTDLGSDLPGPTQILITVSDGIKNYWWAGFLGIIGLIVVFRLIKSTSAGAYVMDRAKLRLPVFGPIIRKSAVARFSRTFGTLLDTGVPILQTLLIVKDTAGNEVISRAVIEMHGSIRDGDTVHEPMKAFPVFPPLVVHMIAVGEETGALDKMLIKVAEAYELEVDDAVNGLAKLIEPLIIVVLGLIIGSIIVCLYLPIFNMANVVK